MKSKIVIFEPNQTAITKIKYLIKRILHRSRYNYKLSSNLNLNIYKKITLFTKIKYERTIEGSACVFFTSIIVIIFFQNDAEKT